jgi:hypothetical protein
MYFTSRCEPTVLDAYENACGLASETLSTVKAISLHAAQIDLELFTNSTVPVKEETSDD